MDYIVSVQDYLYSIKNDKNEYQCIDAILFECEELIKFLKDCYTVQLSEIVLLVNISRKIFAKARQQRNEIVLSRGIIDFGVFSYFGANTDAYDEFLKSDRTSRLERMGCVLWCVAHEFIHIARQHGKITNDNYLIQQALEFDADNYAIAGLYRYLKKTSEDKITRIDIKKIILRSYYYPIRDLIGSGIVKPNAEGKTHPDWYIRIWYTFNKLAGMEVPHVNFGMTELLRIEVEELAKEQVRCEQRYMARSESDIRESEFFVASHLELINPDNYIRQLCVEWPKIEPLVIRNSLLLEDIIASGKKVAIYYGKGNKIIHLLDWIYKKDRVEGNFLPAFHARLDVRRNYYGNDYIIPNAYWRRIPTMLART
ncbi:hypothetical protein [Duganella sp. HH101]|uniref:hypothetical protein n=1 Tax=Duganella sp. HH101 TaxID=1781066 RepID=UPI000892CDFC|nr:hypothetical protein [Duganella sp. HH101]OFA04408.1 hypothetical protein DUGA2_19530 [Duganella sp. HH101]